MLRAGASYLAFAAFAAWADFTSTAMAFTSPPQKLLGVYDAIDREDRSRRV